MKTLPKRKFSWSISYGGPRYSFNSFEEVPVWRDTHGKIRYRIPSKLRFYVGRCSHNTARQIKVYYKHRISYLVRRDEK